MAVALFLPWFCSCFLPSSQQKHKLKQCGSVARVWCAAAVSAKNTREKHRANCMPKDGLRRTPPPNSEMYLMTSPPCLTPGQQSSAPGHLQLVLIPVHCRDMPPKRSLGRAVSKSMPSRTGSSKAGSRQETRTAKRPRQASGKVSQWLQPAVPCCPSEYRRRPRSSSRDVSVYPWFCVYEIIK